MGLAAIQSTRLDERLRRELGPAVLAALDDPDVDVYKRQDRTHG